jgi:hypothetical protein
MGGLKRASLFASSTSSLFGLLGATGTTKRDVKASEPKNLVGIPFSLTSLWVRNFDSCAVSEAVMPTRDPCL